MTRDERFDSKWVLDKKTGCHMWQAGLNQDGYGTFRGVHSRMAHRFAWVRKHGSILAGLVIDHKCRNRACVNPKHMRVVDRCTNVLENSNAAAVALKAQTHCKYGHEFTPENTYLYGPRNQWRQCKTCHKRIAHAWYIANK